VREAFTRETEFSSVESDKAYSRNTLKSQTYYENDGNWVHLAENRDFWKKEVVEKVKFPYNYRYPDAIVDAQPEPPPELDFWDDWIRKKQPVPEPTPPPPPPPPPPPRETPKTPKTQKKQEKKQKNQRGFKEGTRGRVLSPLSHMGPPT